MSNVIELFVGEGETLLDIEANTVLQAAIDLNLDHVMIIGCLHDGEYYFASTTSDVGTHLLWMERFKQTLLEK